MHDVLRQVFEAYAKVSPRDLPDTRFFVNSNTVKLLSKTSLTVTGGFTLLGLPIYIDDRLPDSVVKIETENPHDRALRRVLEHGNYVNVSKLNYPPPPPPPTPTLGALLRHWRKKVWR